MNSRCCRIDSERYEYQEQGRVQDLKFMGVSVARRLTLASFPVGSRAYRSSPLSTGCGTWLSSTVQCHPLKSRVTTFPSHRVGRRELKLYLSISSWISCTSLLRCRVVLCMRCRRCHVQPSANTSPGRCWRTLWFPLESRGLSGWEEATGYFTLILACHNEHDLPSPVPRPHCGQVGPNLSSVLNEVWFLFIESFSMSPW